MLFGQIALFYHSFCDNLRPFGNLRAADVLKMCNYFINYYIFSSCSQPDSHILQTSLDGNKKSCCSASPHDRFIVVVGRCHLCSRWKISTIICYDFSAVGSRRQSNKKVTISVDIVANNFKHMWTLYRPGTSLLRSRLQPPKASGRTQSSFWLFWRSHSSKLRSTSARVVQLLPLVALLAPSSRHRFWPPWFAWSV